MAACIRAQADLRHHVTRFLLMGLESDASEGLGKRGSTLISLFYWVWWRQDA